MSCSVATSEEVEAIKQESYNQSAYKDLMDKMNKERVIHLKRGGCFVTTKDGPVQYGIPPETVKDHLSMGMDVPNHFILPSKRFDRKHGVNVAEFEFPAYFNFFLKKKQINLICTAEAEIAIRTVFQETLIGPKDFPELEEEFYHTFDKSAIPDFPKERSYFAKNPLSPSELVTIDHLLRFTIFDESGVAYLQNEVAVRMEHEHFVIIEEGLEIAKIKDEVDVVVNSELLDAHNHTSKTTFLSMLSDKKNDKKVKLFEPPLFGVTVLGASHGFDPCGSTSGYIIWINGRGIMLDPPPFSQQILKENGIPPTIIESIIISHCHADHDAGAFQKILDSQKVELITTKTIVHSFLRKYSALTDMDMELLRKLFVFRPVIIGAPMIIHGAQFRFFYSLHTIPCIGFEVYYNDKSIYFSGDTFYHPEKIFELKQQNLMSQRRYEMLANIKWNYSLIIHEAGVPPIHTPVSVLAKLPSNIKGKILLVHIAKKDVPKESGLMVAKPGFENTVAIPVTPPKSLQIYKKIDLLSQIEVFENISLKSARDLIQTSTEEHYLSGQIIIKQGTSGSKFYIIEKGVCRIYNEGKEFERYAVAGDYFGEVALVGQKRGATVAAVTDVTLFVVEKHDLLFILGDGKGIESMPLKKLFNLTENRKSKAHETIKRNSVLSELPLAQKTQLEMILVPRNYEDSSIVWKAGEQAKFVFIIVKGTFAFINSKEADHGTFESGAYIGEYNALVKGEALTTTVQSVTESIIYIITKADFLGFLEKNPGLLVLFQDVKFIE